MRKTAADIKEVLLREYGISATAVLETPGGWSASAYKIQAEDGDYFLKVYDKHRHSTHAWLERIDHYMPIVLWLYGNTKLRENMVVPVLARDGSYGSEDENHLYIIFPFIAGKTLANEALSLKQLRELAGIVAELHYCDMKSLPGELLREIFDNSFCDTLCDRLNEQEHSGEHMETLSPYFGTITFSIEMLCKSVSCLKNADLPFVLCHTDIHGGNLIRSARMILVDWEGLKLAPVEADLFAFSEGFFFDDVWNEFIDFYRTANKNYRPNPQAMLYYRLRRRLKDIFEFVESLLFDDIEHEKRNHSIQNLRSECEKLSKLLFDAEQ